MEPCLVTYSEDLESWYFRPSQWPVPNTYRLFNRYRVSESNGGFAFASCYMHANPNRPDDPQYATLMWFNGNRTFLTPFAWRNRDEEPNEDFLFVADISNITDNGMAVPPLPRLTYTEHYRFQNQWQSHQAPWGTDVGCFFDRQWIMPWGRSPSLTVYRTVPDGTFENQGWDRWMLPESGPAGVPWPPTFPQWYVEQFK